VQQRHATLLREAAHSLKSRSGTLGAQRLAHLCQHLEGAGRTGTFEQVDHMAQQVRDTFIETCARFCQELEKRAA
jgi:HPt (histidine-containing phosphotransfer) domain-containing protein